MASVVDALCFRPLSLALVLASAAGAGGCSEAFGPASLVTTPRVLAVVADPPQALPGDVVTLTPVVASPDGAVALDATSSTWWRCPDTDSDALTDLWQCSVPEQRLDLATSTSYVDTVPADLFGENATIASQMLLAATVGFTRIVGSTTTALDTDIESFKRITVFSGIDLGTIDPRLADLDANTTVDGPVAANTNPVLTAVTVHADKAAGDVVTTLQAGKTYAFVPQIDDASIESFFGHDVDLAGLDPADDAAMAELTVDDVLRRVTRVQRCELPTFNWFVTAGRLRQEFTVDEGVVARAFDVRGVDCPSLDGDARSPEVTYVAPTGDEEDPLPKSGVVHAWVVVRDGRGGTAVQSFDLPVAK
jgi:hypothetical protein